VNLTTVRTGDLEKHERVLMRYDRVIMAGRLPFLGMTAQPRTPAEADVDPPPRRHARYWLGRSARSLVPLLMSFGVFVLVVLYSVRSL
jgi:hypothetical protein